MSFSSFADMLKHATSFPLELKSQPFSSRCMHILRHNIGPHHRSRTSALMYGRQQKPYPDLAMAVNAVACPTRAHVGGDMHLRGNKW
jgi:hypothetical protein